MSVEEIKEIPINKLFVGDVNVRKTGGDITELLDSIKEKGILQPIIVRPNKKGYEIVSGGRRFIAGKMAGLKTIRAIVKEIDDTESIEISLVENIQRNNLDLTDEARAYELLLELHGDKKTVAKRLGKQVSVKYISDTIAAYKIEKTFRVKDAEVKVVKAGRRKDELGDEKVISLPKGHAVQLKKAFDSVLVIEEIPEKKREEKIVEVGREIAPLTVKDAKEVLKIFKMKPEKPIKEVVAQVLAKETGIELKVYLNPKLAKGLYEASQERGLTMEALLPIAVEFWLENLGRKR